LGGLGISISSKDPIWGVSGFASIVFSPFRFQVAISEAPVTQHLQAAGSDFTIRVGNRWAEVLLCAIRFMPRLADTVGYHLDSLQQLPHTTFLPQNGEKNGTVTASAVSAAVSA
jgi:energy-coupling factor transporter transmembrane protein EcfT